MIQWKKARKEQQRKSSKDQAMKQGRETKEQEKVRQGKRGDRINEE